MLYQMDKESMKMLIVSSDTTEGMRYCDTFRVSHVPKLLSVGSGPSLNAEFIEATGTVDSVLLEFVLADIGDATPLRPPGTKRL